MSELLPTKHATPWLAICLGLGLVAILAAMLLPALAKPNYDGRRNIKCKNNLKQMGLAIHSYYSDRVSTALPILKSFEVSAINDGGLGFDANMLSCRLDPKAVQGYLWNPKLSGGSFVEWNNPNSPLIWDATPHKFNGKVNVLFGDGHVDQLTPERLQEQTK